MPKHDLRTTFAQQFDAVAADNRRLRRALENILKEPHHWCTEGQEVGQQFTEDGSGVLKCSCPKARRDKKIRTALARKVKFDAT